MPAVDWQHLMALGFDNMQQLVEYSDERIKLAVGEAVEAGFPLQGKIEGMPEWIQRAGAAAALLHSCWVVLPSDH